MKNMLEFVLYVLSITSICLLIFIFGAFVIKYVLIPILNYI